MSRGSFSLIAIALLTAALPNGAWADQSGNATLAPNTFLSLDTGTTSAAGGDILWDGAELTPQGRAGLYNLGKHPHVFKSISARHARSAPYNSAPISAGTLVTGDVFGVHTNGGYYAKVIVTAANGGFLSVQYTTFIAAVASDSATALAASAGPVITKLQNNYSYILPGLPNYGIAPGSLFVIFGTGLSSATTPVLQSSAPPGLPTTLNQTSVSVTVNGVTTTPALYYASATAVAAVLPSTTPVGNGTITVTNNGQASMAVPIQVVASAVGLDTLYGSGNGAGVVSDTNFNVLGLTNSAMPGQAVILWGSGVGADTSSDDRTFPQKTNNLSNVPMQIYIGGISANILYRGRSQYPGLDQFDVVVPPNVSTGCYVSVVVMTGSIVSNTITMPVSPTGGPCSDPATGLTGTQLQSVANKTSVNTAAVTVVQEPNGNTNAFVLAGSLGGANYGNGYEYTSQGSCIVVPPGQGDFSTVVQSPLDAGTIQVTGPGGNFTLTGGMGIYSAKLQGSLTAGTYTFTGSGGKDIGSFKSSINVQTPLTLTNQAALATITRSQGATVTWSGGFPNGSVQIYGVVATQFGTQYGGVRFYCYAPVSAGQFTIPAAILLALPPGGGSLGVTDYTAAQTVSATGVDVGLAVGSVTFKLSSTFK